MATKYYYLIYIKQLQMHHTIGKMYDRKNCFGMKLHIFEMVVKKIRTWQ